MERTLALEHPPFEKKKMKQPTPIWQVISITVTLLIAIITGWVSINNRQAAIEVRVQKLESDTYNNMLKVEKSFDKLEKKIDDLNITNTQILIQLQNKANRN